MSGLDVNEKTRRRADIAAQLREHLGAVPAEGPTWQVIETCLVRRIPIEVLAALAVRVQKAVRRE